MKSRLETVRDAIVDGLSGIKDSAYPGTSTTPYRSNVKSVQKGYVRESEMPFLCVDFDSLEFANDATHGTSNWQVFDLLSHFTIRGWYGSAQQTIPGQTLAPMEAVGHGLAHDVMRWLAWNALTYRTNADPDLRWMVDDRNFKLKMEALDIDQNRGRFLIDFWIRVNATTRDLI